MIKKEENFKKLRNELDRIDANLITILAKRFQIIKKIAKLKQLLNLPIEDKKRELNVLKKRKSIALKHKLSGGFITEIFKNIFKESKILQMKEIQSSGFDKKGKK